MSSPEPGQQPGPAPRQDSIQAAPGRRYSPGLILLWAAVVCICIAAGVRVVLLVQQARKDSPGTTSDPASFGYDLSSFTLPREALAVRRAPGVFKPQRYHELLTAAQIAEKNAREHGKTLVGSDRVIGVEINGEARAYPLRFLNWHEVCNDSLGGEQIAVTYSGLSDSAAVFLLSGFAPAAGVETAWPAGLKDSGLVHNSIALLSEEWLPAAQANLWRQLDGMAIAGPRQGERLERLPLTLCEWSDWAAAHPGSTVAGPDPAAHEQYKSNPYGAYFQTQRLDFPVLPEPAKFRGQHGEWRKSRCLILRWKGEDYWCPFGLLIGSEVQDGVSRMKLSAAGRQFSFAWRPAEEGFSQESAWMEPAALPEAGLSCLGSGLYFACEASLGKKKMLPDSFMRELSER